MTQQLTDLATFFERAAAPAGAVSLLREAATVAESTGDIALENGRLRGENQRLRQQVEQLRREKTALEVQAQQRTQGAGW